MLGGNYQLALYFIGKENELKANKAMNVNINYDMKLITNYRGSNRK